VLQAKAGQLKNVTLITNAATQAITGDGRVTGLTYQDRATQVIKEIALDGVFVQIGLQPNTEWVPAAIDQNQHHEIIVDAKNATNLAGVFAAGDCTDSAYKQIVIATGAGASAALSAFDYLIRS
jgi:alkyl hydroperoxide reductase subunit F